MSKRYPEDCIEYNGFCLYTRFERITTSHPCINGSDQLPQITEINNVNNENYIPAEPNSQIQHYQVIRNYLIQPPLTPVQANIQINNNLQRQLLFASQTSNVTV
ncbi:1853_t:CDS:2 [Gigaspora margarita]|uniref:1853_t:CDS:1 n=1 Tax=Gigaspora margarita TaxID=4874 RepID=A0ABN7VGZ4_GIGMA|nr:1853_t:CDS:2 [Gigaspora margarita]